MGEEFIHSGSVVPVLELLLPSAVSNFRVFGGGFPMLGDHSHHVWQPGLISDVMSDAEAPGRWKLFRTGYNAADSNCLLYLTSLPLSVFFSL